MRLTRAFAITSGSPQDLVFGQMPKSMDFPVHLRVDAHPDALDDATLTVEAFVLERRQTTVDGGVSIMEAVTGTLVGSTIGVGSFSGEMALDPREIAGRYVGVRVSTSLGSDCFGFVSLMGVR